MELGPAVMALVIAGLDAIMCLNRAIEERGLGGEVMGVRWWGSIDGRAI